MQSITVKRGFSVTPLLDIENAEFAHWYCLGVWWAMYGDEQGKGQYRDRYIIDVLHHGILSHWFDSPTSGWFPMVGFNIGMLHGGMLDPGTHAVRPCSSLVMLTDSQFQRGYQAGRYYRFVECLPTYERMTDGALVETINSWALEYHTWRKPLACLSFVIVCRVGELSGDLLPMQEPERARIEAEDRAFLAAYDATKAELLLPTL
ncbi:MAG TPA: hypothetical protein VFT53_02645 [Candidatus Saccharimonadales bacterium]|nr:hypothetical protein [Candidatus Saccharimonadales bacterium]